MKIVQILYSGLGGHGAVAFTLQQAAEDRPDISFSYIFYGIEDMTENYKEKCSKGNNVYEFIKKNWKIDFPGGIKIYKFLRKVKPDAVIAHNIVLLPIIVLHRFLTRSKYVILGVEHQPNAFKSLKEKCYTVLSFLLADKLVYLTEVYIGQIKQYASLFFDATKIKLIPNALPEYFFHPAKNSSSSAMVISMQSRFTPARDHETLIRAFKNIADKYPGRSFRLILAGDGETKAGVEEIAKAIFPDGDIFFPGNLNETGVIQLLNETDIYVHSSLMETMSTAIMQTMALELPVIATNINGISNMITDGETGLLFEPENVEALTAALVKMIENGDLRTTLAYNAHNYALKNFNAKKSLAAYLELITAKNT